MTLAADDFEAFFAAVHGGQPPFAWQRRLLDTVLEQGRWPDRIVAPTGAGKTAVIDVHVFAVAIMAAGSGPRVPRRLSLVVDRRALVDSQYDLAVRVNLLLREAGDAGILSEVRARLAALRSGRAPNADPLVVAMLRGGVAPSRRWVDDPTAAAIICATPAMWGSRLLFRGYGTSRLARPREAGLLAYDSVIVVDEAHLARQLVATARRIDALEGMASSPPLVPRVQVVEATATIGGEMGLRSIDVTADDLRPDRAGGDVLATRLLAPKPVRMLPSPDWPAGSVPARASLAQMLADHADELLAVHGRTIGCVTNTVATAVAVAAELRKRGRVVELLVGRMRPHDIAALRRRRPKLLTIDGDPDVDVVVATQTVEVGIDADFAAMVTELAAGSALAQRAGRVNRVGRRASTEVRVVVPAGPVGPKGAPPYEADELGPALDWITRRAASDGGLAPFLVAGDPPPPAVLRRLVLGRPEVWDALYLARTSDALFAEPDLELLLADDLEPDTDVSVVVRRRVSDDPMVELLLLRVTPPRAAECFPVTLVVLRALLDRVRAKAAVGAPAVYRWRADELDLLRDEDDPRPGDVIVVGDDDAWFTQGVVSVDGTETSTDVLEDCRDAEPFLMRIGSGMPVDTETGGRMGDLLLARLGSVLSDPAEDGRARRAAMATVIAEVTQRLGTAATEAARERLRVAVGLLGRRLADTAIEIGPASDDGVPAWVVIADQRRRLGDEDVRQTWTGRAVAVGLEEHQADVADRVAEIAGRLALDGPIVEALRLAGALHDEGKRDPRFQNLLRGKDGGTVGTPDAAPLAKSGRRTPAEYRAGIASAGLPTGWRHEQLSSLVAWTKTGGGASAASRLVTRLVGTSHGHGRSTFPHTRAGLVGSDQELAGVGEALHDRGVWDVIVDVTHETHGVWGCAYLEALLRAADGQVSGEADE